MLIKVFSLSFSSTSGGFNDEEIRNFIKDKEVISITDHHFIKNEVPYLTIIVKYTPTQQEVTPAKAVQGQKRDEAWRDSLKESDQGMYDLLREWRKKKCNQEGVPPYILFTNKQLVEIINIRPQSLADLEKIEGFGKAKIEKYGQDILAITKIDLGNQSLPFSSAPESKS